MPDDWVPVDRRWLGIDKRTIAPAIVAFLVIAFFVGVMPAIDRSIDANRQIEAGDVINLGSGLSFVPTVGWNVEDGILTTDESVGGTEDVAHLGATLTDGGTLFTVKTGAFSGTTEALLKQAKSLNDAYGDIEGRQYTGETFTVTTTGGTVGIAVGFVGTNIEGMIIVFVVDDVGVEYIIQGPPGSLALHTDEITGMVESLATRSEVSS